jgi:hypothetical protein
MIENGMEYKPFTASDGLPHCNMGKCPAFRMRVNLDGTPRKAGRWECAIETERAKYSVRPIGFCPPALRSMQSELVQLRRKVLAR